MEVVFSKKSSALKEYVERDYTLLCVFDYSSNAQREGPRCRWFPRDAHQLPYRMIEW
jgi:hypothetical protein